MAAGSNKLSMTNFMDYARTGVIFAVAALLMVSLLEIGRAMISSITAENVAPDVPLPDYAFGGLQGIRFPYQDPSTRPTSYESRLSHLPTFGETSLEGLTLVNVYELNNMAYTLSSDQHARQIAIRLGFDEEPHIIDQRTYLYTYPGPPLSESLQIDLKTMFVNFESDYLASSNIFGTFDSRGERQLPQRVEAIAATKQFLSEGGILPDDLSDEAANVNYLTSIGNSLQPVNSALEADYAEVSLSRSPVWGTRDGEPEPYNFYGPDGYGSIYAIVGRDTTGRDSVVALKYNYYHMNLDKTGTYLMRSTASAWESLLAGDAYVLNPRGVRNAVIRSVELGYYESHAEQNYLLPIYVFKGDNGVVAYVQALDPRMYTP